MENKANKPITRRSREFLITISSTIAFVFFIINCYAQKTNNTMLHTKVNGLSVMYKRTGNSPALVLLHGFTQDSRVWKSQIEYLSENFTVIALDAPGAGQSSDPPEMFSLSDWADCLSGLPDVAGIILKRLLNSIKS